MQGPRQSWKLGLQQSADSDSVSVRIRGSLNLGKKTGVVGCSDRAGQPCGFLHRRPSHDKRVVRFAKFALRALWLVQGGEHVTVVDLVKETCESAMMHMSRSLPRAMTARSPDTRKLGHPVWGSRRGRPLNQVISLICSLGHMVMCGWCPAPRHTSPTPTSTIHLSHIPAPSTNIQTKPAATLP